MFDRLKKKLALSTLGFRILVSVGIIILILTGIQLAIFKNSTDQQKDELYQQAAIGKDVLIKQASSIAQSNLSLAIMIANMKLVKEYVGTRDRDHLYSLIKPMIDELNRTREDRLKVHFHLPPGKSFLRVWKPKKNGDDISGFRKTVVKVLTEGQPVFGIEAGRVGLAIRGLAPIFWQGNHPVGSVEVITSLSKVAGLLQKSTGELNQIFAIPTVEATASVSVEKKVGRFRMLTPWPEGIDKSAIDEGFLDQTVQKGFATREYGPFLITASVIPDYKGKPTGIYVRYNNLSVLMANLRNEIITGIAIALGVGILAIFLTVFILRTNLARPLKKVTDLIDRVTDGDLTRSIEPKGAKEMRMLATMTNSFVCRNGQLINMIKGQAGSLKAAATELSDASSAVDTGAVEIDSAAEEVAKASSEAASALDNVARSTQELSEAANEIASSVAETAAATNEAQEKSLVTNEVINELGKNSQKIGGIIEVINSIAEQTNLLALNATIEAARAGEAGKGFAVVANEVKELAKQTSDATDEIARMVHVIQSDTKKAVSSVEDITSSVLHVNDLASTIASAAEEQTATVAEINDSVSAGASKVKELESRAHGLANHANDFSLLAERVKNVNSVVSLLSKILNEAADNFRVDRKVLEDVFEFSPSHVQLISAIFAHYAWFEELQAAVCQDKLPEVETDANRCLLGRWISKNMNSEDGDDASLQELARMHNELHELALGIRDMTESGAEKVERFRALNEQVMPKFFEMLDLAKSIRS